MKSQLAVVQKYSHVAEAAASALIALITWERLADARHPRSPRDTAQLCSALLCDDIHVIKTSYTIVWIKRIYKPLPDPFAPNWGFPIDATAIKYGPRV